LKRVALLTQLGDENDELHREVGKNKKKKEKENFIQLGPECCYIYICKLARPDMA
jgi:hypothetical protein